MPESSRCLSANPLPDFISRRIHEAYTRRAELEWRDRHFFRQPAPVAGSVELHTNDYLQIARHPAVIASKRSALSHERDPAIMSAVFLRETSAQRTFECELASLLGSEDAVLCQSGWAANVGLLQALCSEDRPIYIDFFAHMSLHQGARQTGAPIHAFRHNDVVHLGRCIREHGPGIVLVDSVYSTDGSLCPLWELAQVARASGSVLVVDESHSLGTHGHSGAGLVSDLGLEDDVLFRTASLSKAFGARGGVIACPAAFSDYFRIESSIAIFSSAVHSYEARGFSETLRVVRGADAERKRLHESAARLRAGLARLGYPVSGGSEQIIALEAGTEHRTLVLRDLLAQRGVLGAPFVPPATPRNRSLLRLTVTCAIGDDEIRRVLEACAAVREAVELESWPALRRSRRASRAVGRRAPVRSRRRRPMLRESAGPDPRARTASS